MEKKNVILMFVDDMGIGDISAFNPESKIHTPAIDALAETGAMFTDCHSTSSLCTPSRYGLLTGRYNWRSRLKSAVLPGGAPPLIEEGRDTLASLFHRHGYYTAAVGKWHLGLGWQRRDFDGSEYGIQNEVAPQKAHYVPGGFVLDGMDLDFDKPLTVSPNDFGFDYFYGTAASLDQPPYVYIENHQVIGKPSQVTGVVPLDRIGASQQQLWQRGPIADYYHHRDVIPHMQKKVLDLIDAHADEPFFIYYPTHAVHGPLLPPEGYEGISGLNCYADLVLYVDHMVAEITAKLKEKGLLENTIFLLASDNGCSGVADYPFLTAHGHNPSYIYRGKKSDIWEGGHRIPAILSWPGMFQGKTEISGMSCLADFYATFREMLQESPADDAGEDSFSMMPMLRGEVETVRETVVHSAASGCFSIRDSEWKFELSTDSGGMGGSPAVEGTSEEFPFQLYNMIDDVREQHNVAPQHPDVCARMLQQLLEIVEQGRSNPGPVCENAGMDHWQQLDHLREVTARMNRS
ncbi:MAG: arylsulfatase [Oscillospiraceae bacterium]|nr:arylsulfatase [Oscillospiraceae bacterium]